MVSLLAFWQMLAEENASSLAIMGGKKEPSTSTSSTKSTSRNFDKDRGSSQSSPRLVPSPNSPPGRNAAEFEASTEDSFSDGRRPICTFLASAALSLASDQSTPRVTHNDQHDGSLSLRGGRCEEQQDHDEPEHDGGDGWFGAADGDKEAFGSWGFKDSGFSLAADEKDSAAEPYVVMRGGR